MESRRVRLNLLGRFDARWSDGEPLDLKGKKVRALVAYLAVESGRAFPPDPPRGGRSHRREELATLLWAETGDERARHNLRQALSKIRRTTDALLVARGDVLALDEGCAVDVRDFERLVSGDDPETLRRGLELYRGDLLAGLVVGESAFDDWLRDARERLRDQASDAFERLAAVLTDEDRPLEAVDCHRRRLALDPACEPAHRELMELLARTGRRTDALRQYQKCAVALERELGARPSPETQAVHERLRAADEPPAVLPEDAAVAAPPGEPAAAESEPPSVAVLPFENLSPQEERYFTDGIVEDVITALSRFGSLTVIARESSFAYQGRDVALPEIGRALGAQFIVRGSVQRAGARVRLNVQLVESESGRHLWAQRFDREMDDVFALQDEVTATLVSTLAGRVEAARLARLRRQPTERLDAYEFVLRGKDYHHRTTPEDCPKAIEMFERALELDPECALAHAWLGCGFGQAMHLGVGDVPLDSAETLLDRAQAAAERGLRLDEDESECHRILAQVFILRHDLARARWHQERALFLNPNDDRSVCAMGTILVLAGEPEEAETWVRKAMRLNPYHPEAYWFHLGRALFHAGRDEEALTALSRVSRSRLRERIYRAAAKGRSGGASASKPEAEAVLDLEPDFDAAVYLSTQPYERERDRVVLLEALRVAGL